MEDTVMPSSLIRYCVVLATIGVVTITDAAASGGFFTRGCAARDMQILMMLEQSEGNSAISAEQLNDAVQTMMHARMTCFAGNVPDALAVYDDIARTLTAAGWAQTGHRQVQ
jgi:hypothetical protein